MRRAFTLIDLLVVLAVIALVASILFPIITRAISRAKQASCLSNLHQIGYSIAIYSQDYDDLLPYGEDPSDRLTTCWKTQNNGEFWHQAQSMPYLTDVMKPYTSDPRLWRCPADTGFDKLPYACGQSLSAHPTSFAAFGTSYFYRTELAFRHECIGGVVVYDGSTPPVEHGPADVVLLIDGSRTWHTSLDDAIGCSNALMADGHVVGLTNDSLDTYLDLDPVPGE